MSERARCNLCHAEILWVDSVNGRRMPLDFPPERRWVVDSGTNPIRARERNVYTHHLDTCKTRSKP